MKAICWPAIPQILILIRQTTVSLDVGTYKNSKVIQLVGRSHSDTCNNSTYILPGITVNVRLTKGRREFYFIAKDADSQVTFKILDTRMLVRHTKPNAALLSAHNTILDAEALAQYHLSTIEVKTLLSLAVHSHSL
jgi:hypothetical protein